MDSLFTWVLRGLPLLLLCVSAPVVAGEPVETPGAVRVLTPADNDPLREPKVTIDLVLPPGARSEQLRVVLNSQPLAPQRLHLERGPVPGSGLPPGEQPLRVQLEVPRDTVVLSFLLEDQGRRGPSTLLRLRWAGAREEEFVRKPKLYLLGIGVGSYQGAPLRFPNKDAKDLAAAFASQEGRLFQQVEAHLLLNQAATQRRIIEELQWLERQTTALDMAVLFLAGHGMKDPRSGEYYFIPHDGDVNEPERSLISGRLIQRVVVGIPGKTLLFLDTCHAGGVLTPWRLRGGGDEQAALVKELMSADNGLVVFAASTGRQASQESERWGNGAFTKAVVEGLRGQARLGGSPRVTVNMLEAYMAERVKQLTDGQQTPTTAKPDALPDFPLATFDLPAAPAKARPIYKRWWFWTALGATAAALATGVSLGVGLGGPSASGGQYTLAKDYGPFAVQP